MSCSRGGGHSQCCLDGWHTSTLSWHGERCHVYREPTSRCVNLCLESNDDRWCARRMSTLCQSVFFLVVWYGEWCNCSLCAQLGVSVTLLALYVLTHGHEHQTGAAARARDGWGERHFHARRCQHCARGGLRCDPGGRELGEDGGPCCCSQAALVAYIAARTGLAHQCVCCP